MCDGGHCRSATGEVRVLPSGGSSNLILCRACFDHEIRWRRDRNRDLGRDAQFKLPTWDSLRVYDPSGNRTRGTRRRVTRIGRRR